jgi:hypothetical protein
MSEKRINPITGKKELKIDPYGLPAIWVEKTVVFCDRCRSFNECLSFDEIENETWEELNKLITSIN